MNNIMRQKVLNTHPLFISCLDTNRINNLLHIIESIELKNEFEKRIQDSNIKIKGNIEDSKTQGKSLVVYFKKPNYNGELKDYMHYTIHLCLMTYNLKQNSKIKGITHFTENISKKQKPNIIINVEIPNDKQNSLYFSLTPPNRSSLHIFSQKSQQDAQIFVDILNEYFDENYIDVKGVYIKPQTSSS